ATRRGRGLRGPGRTPGGRIVREGGRIRDLRIAVRVPRGGRDRIATILGGQVVLVGPVVLPGVLLDHVHPVRGGRLAPLGPSIPARGIHVGNVLAEIGHVGPHSQRGNAVLVAVDPRSVAREVVDERGRVDRGRQPRDSGITAVRGIAGGIRRRRITDAEQHRGLALVEDGIVFAGADIIVPLGGGGIAVPPVQRNRGHRLRAHRAVAGRIPTRLAIGRAVLEEVAGRAGEATHATQVAQRCVVEIADVVRSRATATGGETVI